MKDLITVQIADMKFTRQNGKLITYALGSCVGVSFYDPRLKLAALLHILLPEKMNPNDANFFKYADSGVKETLRKLTVLGANRAGIVCKIAGGAKMFNDFSGSAIGSIGQRNIDAVKKVLQMERIYITAQDVGGQSARTMSLDAATGTVYIRKIGQPEVTI